MKKSKIHPQSRLFLNRRMRLHSSGDSLAVNLPERWCVSHGLDESTEIEMIVFPDVLLVLPTYKHGKPSQFKDKLVSVVMMMQLNKKLRDAIKDATKAIKKFRRKLTRDKRKS